MHKTYFDITDNETGNRLKLFSQYEDNREFMLVETQANPTVTNERSFLRITKHTDSYEICAAVNGQVPHGSSAVAGFPQSVSFSIPAYLLPLFKKAVNELQ